MGESSIIPSWHGHMEYWMAGKFTHTTEKFRQAEQEQSCNSGNQAWSKQSPPISFWFGAAEFRCSISIYLWHNVGLHSESDTTSYVCIDRDDIKRKHVMLDYLKFHMRSHYIVDLWLPDGCCMSLLHACVLLLMCESLAIELISYSFKWCNSFIIIHVGK